MFHAHLYLFVYFICLVIVQRVQQLQAGMEDACNRLSPAECARSQWINPTDLNPQLVQQQLDQLKVRCTLAGLLAGIVKFYPLFFFTCAGA